MWKVKIPTLAVRFQILHVNIYILFLPTLIAGFLLLCFSLNSKFYIQVYLIYLIKSSCNDSLNNIAPAPMLLTE